MLRMDDAPRLSSLTSLRLGGRALALATFSRLADLEQLPDVAARTGGTIRMIGGGTNILAADGVLPLLLVRCGMAAQPDILAEEGDLRLVRVEAGMKLPRLLAWCAKAGLTGLEGMAGVPGDVGGAVAGNAGAHGVDMGTVLREVELFTPERGVHTLCRDDVRCAYRSFSLCAGASWFAIGSVVLALHKASPAVIRETMRANMARKLKVQPVRAWSAGCVFKNPPAESHPVSAGKLLEEAGFRGKRLGGMCFSAMHANFLVNEGEGCAAAAFELVRSAQQVVLERFGVSLETEVKLWQF